jgi:hypothetical protein
MTKRFWLDEAENGELVIIDNKKGGYIVVNDADAINIVDLLNEQNDLIEDYNADEVAFECEIKELISENHALEKRCDFLANKLIQKDNIISALARIVDMYVPKNEHDFVAEVINDAMEGENEL